MKSALVFRLLFLLVAAGFGAAVVRAEDLGAVKARMEQRQAAIDALRDRQIAGENNRGFLEVRGTATADQQKTISAENADRGTVYAALAAQAKSTADQVGRQRAQQIAARSRPGVWVQGQDGGWRQKR